jgi:hypothetical protein
MTAREVCIHEPVVVREACLMLYVQVGKANRLTSCRKALRTCLQDLEDA